MKILYNPRLKQRAKEIRKQGVLSEVLLWAHLKGKKIGGYPFTRQKQIGEYIVDFYCSSLKLIIEIDGDSHEGRWCYDINRQHFLESIGLRVIRFNDTDVKRDITAVLVAIQNEIGEIENNPLPPFLRGNYPLETPKSLK